jgi:hypothetical protein
METLACTCHPNWRPFWIGQHHPNCAISLAERARVMLLASEALWDE